jgi:hypothetical protein
MALLNQGLPTLLDHVKRTDPNGAIATIVESLSQSNPILQHMVFQEGNLPTGHRYTSRTALPSVAWRRLNEGVTPGKSETAQIDETTGMLTGMSAVDVEVAKLNGNEAAFRASEDAAFLEAFNNEIATGLFYHSTKTAPEKFHGIAPRLDSTTAPWGKQILLGGGAGGRTASSGSTRRRRTAGSAPSTWGSSSGTTGPARSSSPTSRSGSGSWGS